MTQGVRMFHQKKKKKLKNILQQVEVESAVESSDELKMKKDDSKEKLVL